ncbi:MAG: penicillin-binding protein 2 [Pseudomonadota bacterium]
MMMRQSMRRNAIKIQGERSSSFSLARGRLMLISSCFVLAYIIMALRAFDLAVIQGDLTRLGVSDVSLVEMDEVPKASTVSVARRGDIIDRNGVLLATTLETSSLYADPRYIAEPDVAAKRLSEVFTALSYGDVLQKLQSDRRFVWIKRGILPREEQAILEIGEPGLKIEKESRRIYPHGQMFAHLLGYTNVDNKGQGGVERGFDNILTDGRPLSLTLDVRLQHILRREVSSAIEEYSALGGVGVIMDVHSGEILAGVSMPDFDPHKVGKAAPQELFNRLTLGVYEFGSVFKIFSTAALFEVLNVPMETTFDASEPIKRGRFTINDYHAENRILSVPEVFMHSSNIGSAMMGEAVGTQALRNFYSDLGLLTPLNFEVREVGKPMVPEPWGEIHTLTASYGHGVATTAVQLTSAVSTIVNGGYAVKPTLVMNAQKKKEAPIDRLTRIALQNAQKGQPKAQADVRVLSKDASDKMRSLLRLVVTDGTGKKANVKGFAVGGKTGTAEKPGVKGYDRKRLISSFMGVFPMDAPRYAIFVAVDEPKGTKASYGYATGGWVAAPAVANIVRSMASVLGLKPDVQSTDMAAPLRQLISMEGAHE